MDLFDEVDRPLPFQLPNSDEYSYEWVESSGFFKVSVPGGALSFSSDFLPRGTSDEFVRYFQQNRTVGTTNVDWRAVGQPDLVDFENVLWKQEVIKMYGDVHPLPRLTSWYGDSGKSYSYSGITSQPNPWTPKLRDLKLLVEAATMSKFNSVLLNWYRDGSDYLSWHADDEPELGQEPTIASVNFGETRDFVLRRNENHAEKIIVPLGHGSLLVMSGKLQSHWQHSVPKRKKIHASRFNLTFRSIA